jgi:hypothetical protein
VCRVLLFGPACKAPPQIDGRHACPGSGTTRRSPLCTSQPEHSASAVREARLGELSPSENIRGKILNGR